MTDTENEVESVTVLKPDLTLKRRAGKLLGKLMRGENIQKADALIQQDAHMAFIKDAAVDLAELSRHIDILFSENVSLEERDHSVKAASEIAFRIKSRAGTFGYQLASDIAQALLHYLETSGSTLNAKGFRAHYEALRGILSGRLQGDGGKTGQEILTELTALHPSAADI